MPDWHYHANHVDAPARGSKAAALKDARRLHVAYDTAHQRDTRPVFIDTIREHGSEFPAIVKCRRSDCVIRRGEGV